MYEITLIKILSKFLTLHRCSSTSSWSNPIEENGHLIENEHLITLTHITTCRWKGFKCTK